MEGGRERERERETERETGAGHRPGSTVGGWPAGRLLQCQGAPSDTLLSLRGELSSLPGPIAPAMPASGRRSDDDGVGDPVAPQPPSLPEPSGDARSHDGDPGMAASRPAAPTPSELDAASVDPMNIDAGVPAGGSHDPDGSDTRDTDESGPDWDGTDRKSTRLNSSHSQQSRMPSSA